MTDASNMQILQRTMADLEAICAELPDSFRPHFGNAMLNLGLGHLIELHGQRGTASLLARVVDSLAAADSRQPLSPAAPAPLPGGRRAPRSSGSGS